MSENEKNLLIAIFMGWKEVTPEMLKQMDIDVEMSDPDMLPYLYKESAGRTSYIYPRTLYFKKERNLFEVQTALVEKGYVFETSYEKWVTSVSEGLFQVTVIGNKIEITCCDKDLLEALFTAIGLTVEHELKNTYIYGL
jgi:hypothetical protein